MADSDFQILLGVKLDTSDIQAQLKSQVRKITVKVDLDKAHLNQQIAAVKKQISELGSINTTGGNGKQQSSNVNQIIQDYNRLKKTLSELNSKEYKLTGLDPERDRAQIAALQANIDTLKKSMNELYARSGTKLSGTQMDSLNEAMDKADRKVLELKGHMEDVGRNNEITARFKEMKSLANDISKMSVKQAGLDETSAQYKVLGQQIDTAKQKYEDLKAKYGSGLNNKQMEELNGIFTTMGQKIDEVKAKSDDAKSRMSGWASGFKSSFMSAFTYMASGTAVFYALRRAASAAYDEIKKIDSAMTQLKIVTNMSDSESATYMKNIAQTAKQTGTSIDDLVDSTTTYARLGYNIDESSILAKYTGMLSRVGDIDVSSAQNAVTAIVKAFSDEIDIDNIESVMDRLVKVGKQHCPVVW